jgi:hypothetical protein
MFVKRRNSFLRTVLITLTLLHLAAGSIIVGSEFSRVSRIWQYDPDHLYYLEVSRGEIYYVEGSLTPPHWHSAQGWQRGKGLGFDDISYFGTLFGFWSDDFSLQTEGSEFQYEMTRVSCWFLLFVTGVVPYGWVCIKWLSRKKRVSGAYPCERCGYDMRESPQCCPECGALRSLHAKGNELEE